MSRMLLSGGLQQHDTRGAIRISRLAEFIAQEEARDVGPANAERLN
jgi:hypothetical protein